MKIQSRLSLSGWVMGLGLISGASIALGLMMEPPTRQCIEKQITILGTNDLHGAVEPSEVRIPNIPVKTVGGMSFWSGAVDAIRKGVREQLTDVCGGVLLVDAGDQFQGTLLSNYSEGELMFDLMNRVGYDAVVPGNHDYDFGPAGWLDDVVTKDTKDQDPRGVIKGLAAKAKFDLISANTYLKNSLFELGGELADVESIGCKSDEIIDWSRARRPDFLKPYVIKVVAGVRVALIGLDNPQTPSTTTAANVSDLCFREPFEEYMMIRKELQNRADVFVLVIHDGDAKNDFKMSTLVKEILAADPRGVDAVVAGHTHFVNEVNVDGVPAIQSGANGEKFGRIDLVYNTQTKQVDRPKGAFMAGAFLDHHECDRKSQRFCTSATDEKGKTEISFETKKIVRDQSAQKLIDRAQNELAPLANRILGTATQRISRDRINESPLANALSDALLAASNAEIAVINTGGIRTDLDEGDLNYESFYRVLPFANHAVILSPMDSKTLVRLVKRAAATCGGYGALMFSGIAVEFERNCEAGASSVDEKAKVLEIKLTSGKNSGTVIYDARGATPILKSMAFKVATLDFLASGGSGYDSFIGVPMTQDLGIFREVLVERFLKNPGRWEAKVDGRWKNVSAPQL